MRHWAGSSGSRSPISDCRSRWTTGQITESSRLFMSSVKQYCPPRVKEASWHQVGKEKMQLLQQQRCLRSSAEPDVQGSEPGDFSTTIIQVRN